MSESNAQNYYVVEANVMEDQYEMDNSQELKILLLQEMGLLKSHSNSSANASHFIKNQQNPFAMPWWLQVLFGLAFGFIALVAISGNAIVMWIILGHRVMRTSTNCFLFNLALADFCNGAFNFPFVVISVLAHYNWFFGIALCKVQQFVGNCVLTCIVFTLVTMALERYIFYFCKF